MRERIRDFGQPGNHAAQSDQIVWPIEIHRQSGINQNQGVGSGNDPQVSLEAARPIGKREKRKRRAQERVPAIGARSDDGATLPDRVHGPSQHFEIEEGEIAVKDQPVQTTAARFGRSGTGRGVEVRRHVPDHLDSCA